MASKELDKGNFLYHTSCTECSSSDGMAVYDNGTSYCFVCHSWHKEDGLSNNKPRYQRTVMRDLLSIEYKPLTKRCIPEPICKMYKYGYGTDMNGNTCQIATYYNKDKESVAQKLRYPDKTFKFIGAPKEAMLYGQQLFGEGGKKLTITEGEIDALSVATAFEGKYPVVSLPNGASSAKKAIAKHLDWISTFEEVYLWFDNDEPGKKAIEECIGILPAGKVKVIQHPDYKDANDVLVNEGKAGVVDSFYKAKQYRPDGILQAIELVEEAIKPVSYGLSWAFEGITKATYGRRLGELHLLGAGVGTGKTDFCMQQIAYDIMNGIKVGTFMLEQKPTETIKRIAGKIDGKLYHLPNEGDSSYNVEDLKKTIMTINDTENLFIYDNFGSIEWDIIKEKIRYMAHNYGVQTFYLDNITAITAQASDERRYLDSFMEELASLCKELNIWVLAISHLNAPSKGNSHETGGKVEAKQFTGSRAIMRWAFNMYGLERNSQHQDVVERQKMIFRILKDRYSGQSVGKLFSLRYDINTGLLKEVDEEWSSLEDENFKNETNTDF